MDVIQQTRAGGPSASLPSDADLGGPLGDELGQFASVVLADTEDTWNSLFSQAGQSYHEPNLVLFSGRVQSACGYASAAVGPFYCPADGKVYLDLAFFDQLARRFGAPGDFAQAYVIAHEVGHHVQNLLGISDRVHEAQRRLPRAEGNEMSVRLELQADCLAGVWGHHAHRQRNLLEPGDVEEGMAAAGAVGDDNMQRRATGTIQPESWTHSSARQRQSWFRRGLERGDPDACDTFAG
jgi:predicted metalloprotease